MFACLSVILALAKIFDNVVCRLYSMKGADRSYYDLELSSSQLESTPIRLVTQIYWKQMFYTFMSMNVILPPSRREL